MSTEPTQAVAEPVKSALVEIIDSHHLPSENALVIRDAYTPFFAQAADWKAKVDTVTDVKVARASRLVLKRIRCDAKNKKDELKDTVLKVGRAIDEVYRKIEGTITPMEDQLEKIEKAAEIAEAERKAKLKTDRDAELKQYGVDTQFYALGEMPDESYSQLLQASKISHETKIAEERRRLEEARIFAEKAEQERIAREKAETEERERVRLENERLKKEAAERRAAEKAKAEQEAKERAEREAADKAERDRIAAEAAAKAEAMRLENEVREKALREKAAEAERAAKEIAEKARIEREAAEAKAKAIQDAADALAAKERAAREKAEADAKALRDAAEAKAAAEREAAAKAARAPDREKVIAYAAQVRALKMGDLQSAEAKAVAAKVADQQEKFAIWAERQATTLL